MKNEKLKDKRDLIFNNFNYLLGIS
jgi:hypothetical protein